MGQLKFYVFLFLACVQIDIFRQKRMRVQIAEENRIKRGEALRLSERDRLRLFLTLGFQP